MRAAGVNQASGPVAPLELADPRPLRDGEILLQVQAAGVGNWDEFVRTGDWDTGARRPMALGVAQALAQVRRGAHGTAIVLRPGSAEARR